MHQVKMAPFARLCLNIILFSFFYKVLFTVFRLVLIYYANMAQPLWLTNTRGHVLLYGIPLIFLIFFTGMWGQKMYVFRAPKSQSHAAPASSSVAKTAAKPAVKAAAKKKPAKKTTKKAAPKKVAKKAPAKKAAAKKTSAKKTTKKKTTKKSTSKKK